MPSVLRTYTIIEIEHPDLEVRKSSPPALSERGLQNTVVALRWRGRLERRYLAELPIETTTPIPHHLMEET